MNKPDARKQYVIDKKFQYRTTFSIIGVIFVLMSIVIGMVTFHIVANNKKLENILRIESAVFEFQMTTLADEISRQYTPTLKKNLKNHSRNMENLRKIILRNNTLLIGIIAFVVLMAIVLFVILIRVTHRISGPMFVMTRYMNEIINGKWPETRPLRKKDEFKDFYEVFKTMIHTMKNNQK